MKTVTTTAEPGTRRYGHRAQNQAADFHLALDIPIGETPELRRVPLRCGLIAEEARETIEAAEAGDIVGAIDGLCDLIVVAYGAALEWGVDLAPFCDEVHRSNMAKVGGPTRADGKKLKPEGWQPPNIAGILRKQLAEAQPGKYDSVIGRSASAAVGG